MSELKYLNDGERMEMEMLVHFAKLARQSPGSKWSPFGKDECSEEEMISSAEMIRQCDQEILRLTQIARRRAALGVGLN